MELRQLEYFLAVSELKSFTKTAEKFFVSQPAITSAIGSLEKELNTRLFLRSNRQFSLTTEGEVFYNYIKLVMKDVNVAVSQLNKAKNKRENTLKLAVAACMSERVVFPAYMAFSKRYPEARLRVTECTSHNAMHLLESDAVDTALLLDMKDDVSLHRQTMLTAPIQIYYHEGFGHCSFAERRSRLKNDVLVFLCDDSPKTREQIITRLDIPEENIMGKISNVPTLTALLRCENTAVILPGFLTIDAPGCTVENAAPSLIGAFSLHWRKKHVLSELGTLFLDFLTGYLNGQEPCDEV